MCSHFLHHFWLGVFCGHAMPVAVLEFRFPKIGKRIEPRPERSERAAGAPFRKFQPTTERTKTAMSTRFQSRMCFPALRHSVWHGKLPCPAAMRLDVALGCGGIEKYPSPVIPVCLSFSCLSYILPSTTNTFRLPTFLVCLQ